MSKSMTWQEAQRNLHRFQAGIESDLAKRLEKRGANAKLIAMVQRSALAKKRAAAGLPPEEPAQRETATIRYWDTPATLTIEER